MKRKFKIVSRVFLFLAMGLFMLSIILSGMFVSEEAEMLTIMVAMPLEVFAAITGILLIGAQKDAARRIGHGLAVSAFVMGFAISLAMLSELFCAVIMLVACIMLVISYIFLLVVRILNKGSQEPDFEREDMRIVKVREWKQILDEGIITPEEFEEKRVEILGLKKDKAKK